MSGGGSSGDLEAGSRTVFNLGGRCVDTVEVSLSIAFFGAKVNDE